MNIGAAADELGLSIPTVAGALKNLLSLVLPVKLRAVSRTGVRLRPIFADCHCRDRTASEMTVCLFGAAHSS